MMYGAPRMAAGYAPGYGAPGGFAPNPYGGMQPGYAPNPYARPAPAGNPFAARAANPFASANPFAVPGMGTGQQPRFMFHGQWFNGMEQLQAAAGAALDKNP